MLLQHVLDVRMVYSEDRLELNQMVAPSSFR